MKKALTFFRSFFYSALLPMLIIILIVSAWLFVVKRERHDEKEAFLHYDGFFPHSVNNPFREPPRRVIILRPEIADTLIRLGVGESVIAAYISPERRKDIPCYRKKMPNAQILTKDLTREEAIFLNPDFIIGWRGGFDAKRMGSPAFWNQRNVPTYVEENSGAMPDPYPPFKKINYPSFSVDNEIQFIKNMGTIFQKNEEAQKEVEKIEKTLAEIQSKVKQKGSKLVLTMQFRRGQVEVLGDKTLSGDIIRRIGCKNVDYEGLLMPVENFLFTNPDNIIVIYDFVGGDASLKNQLQLLKGYPYSQIRAVKEGKLGAMQYFHGLIATNVHTDESIRHIYEAIYESPLSNDIKSR